MPCVAGELNGANLVLDEFPPCEHVHWSDFINDYLNIVEIVSILHSFFLG